MRRFLQPKFASAFRLALGKRFFCSDSIDLTNPRAIIMSKPIFDYDAAKEAKELFSVCHAHRECYIENITQHGLVADEALHYAQAIYGLRELASKVGQHSISRRKLQEELSSWRNLVLQDPEKLNKLEATSTMLQELISHDYCEEESVALKQ